MMPFFTEARARAREREREGKKKDALRARARRERKEKEEEEKMGKNEKALRLPEAPHPTGLRRYAVLDALMLRCSCFFK